MILCIKGLATCPAYLIFCPILHTQDFAQFMVSHMLILFPVVSTLPDASSAWNAHPLLTYQLSVNHVLVNHWLSVDSSGTLLTAVFPVSSHHIVSQSS